MALTRLIKTDKQRKSVALEYLKAFDNGGVTSTGGSILDLFASDTQVWFPKSGLANDFEIRDWLIQSCVIYLDPDYAAKDTARYPWLQNVKWD
jgi:hypothetical protein